MPTQIEISHNIKWRVGMKSSMSTRKIDSCIIEISITIVLNCKQKSRNYNTIYS